MADAAGRYRFKPGAKLPEATHGICPSCCAQMRASLQAPEPEPELALVD